MRPTLLYINFGTVIPAKAGIQLTNTGFRVKPGMTINVKGLLMHYTRIAKDLEDNPRTILEFEERFATEEACRQYLIDLCWLDGFCCLRCGHR